MTPQQFRKRRKALGFSMVKAAELSRVPYRTWQSWEGGEVPIPAHAETLLDHLFCAKTHGVTKW